MCRKPSQVCSPLRAGVQGGALPTGGGAPSVPRYARGFKSSSYAGIASSSVFPATRGGSREGGRRLGRPTRCSPLRAGVQGETALVRFESSSVPRYARGFKEWNSLEQIGDLVFPATRGGSRQEESPCCGHSLCSPLRAGVQGVRLIRARGFRGVPRYARGFK